MNSLCRIIRETVKPNFLNIRTSLKTYNRDSICYGAPEMGVSCASLDG